MDEKREELQQLRKLRDALRSLNNLPGWGIWLEYLQGEAELKQASLMVAAGGLDGAFRKEWDAGYMTALNMMGNRIPDELESLAEQIESLEKALKEEQDDGE